MVGYSRAGSCGRSCALSACCTSTVDGKCQVMRPTNDDPHPRVDWLTIVDRLDLPKDPKTFRVLWGSVVRQKPHERHCDAIADHGAEWSSVDIDARFAAGVAGAKGR